VWKMIDMGKLPKKSCCFFESVTHLGEQIGMPSPIALNNFCDLFTCSVINTEHVLIESTMLPPAKEKSL